ncbi:MAG: hypothetical protein U0736_18650 [Gemmataceae bacterium]
MNRHLVTALTPVALLAAVSLADAQGRHGGSFGSFRPSGPSPSSFRPTTFPTTPTNSFRPTTIPFNGNTLSTTVHKPLGTTTFHHAPSGLNTIKPLTVTGSTFNHKPSLNTPIGRPHAGHGIGTTTLAKIPTTVKLPLHNGTVGNVSVGRYANLYGVKFRHGFYYRGLNHQHWTRRCFCTSHGCWCWFDPCTSAWYYWCAPRGCYLPVTCLTIAPPVVQSADIGETDAPTEIQDIPEVDPNELPELPQK